MVDFVSKPLANSTVVIQLSGNFDDASRVDFFTYVSDLLESGISHVVIECEKLGHLSSSALASLLTARKRAMKSGSKISLTHLNSSIAQVLEITKLGRILSIYPTTESAIASNKDKLFCFG